MPFYSDQISNMVKMHAAKMDQSYSQVRYALVKEYDPKQHAVKMGFFNPATGDHDLISGWMPIITSFIGTGDDTADAGGDAIPWGIVNTPIIDQPMLVIPQHGDFQNGLVVGGTYVLDQPNATNVPQADDEYCEAGEWLLKHKSGSFIKFFNNGDVKIHTDHDLIFDVGHDWMATVANDTTFDIKHDFTRTIGNDESATIHGNQTLHLDGNRSDTIGGNDTLNLSGNRSETVGGNQSLSVGGNRSADIGGTDTHTIGAVLSVTAGGVITFNSGALFDVNAPIIELD